ncbi:hypothetical protein THAOC_01553, partial [Thalassiosira oceanica]
PPADGVGPRLPVVDRVHHHRHRLPDEAERDPEYYIPDRRPPVPPVDPLRHEDQRQLRHHGEEGVDLDHVAGYADEDLVHHGREEEDHERGAALGHAYSDAGEVHVSDEPVVDRHIPEPPVGRLVTEDVKLGEEQVKDQLHIATRLTTSVAFHHHGDRELEDVLADYARPDLATVLLEVHDEVLEVGLDDLHREEGGEGGRQKQLKGEDQYPGPPHERHSRESDLVCQGRGKPEVIDVAKPCGRDVYPDQSVDL